MLDVLVIVVATLAIPALALLFGVRAMEAMARAASGKDQPVSRHAFVLAIAEAGVWAYLFYGSFDWDPHWTNWVFRTMGLLLTADCVYRAIHARRERSALSFPRS